MKQFTLLIGLLVCFIVQTSYALDIESEDEDLFATFGDEDIITLASGIEQPIKVAPAVATVITANMIEEIGAVDLNEILELVPGLHVGLSSNRFFPTYQFRGIATDYNPQVLMLLNGVPIKHETLGNSGYHPNIRVNMIDRIEVIRGPGSAVYGADAFAGVINIVTKTAKSGQTNRFGGKAGSFGTKEIWADLNWNTPSLDFRFMLEHFQTDGDNDRIITVDSQSLFDTLTGLNVSNAPGPAQTREKRTDLRFDVAAEKWKVQSYYSAQRDMGTGPGIAGALDPNGHEDIDNLFLDWKYHNKLNDWSIEYKVSYTDLQIETDFTLFPAGTVLPIGLDGNVSPVGSPVLFTDGFIGNPTSNEKHTRVSVISVHTSQSHTTRLAIGGSAIDLKTTETKNFGPGVIDGTVPVVDGTLTDVSSTPYVYLADTSRDNFYLSMQDEWHFKPDWRFTVGLRYDDYSDFGSTVNPRLALVWETAHNLTTKFLVARAFRAPSFFELNAINNPVALGNSNLDPEVINTYEIAFDWRPTYEVRYGFNIFNYSTEDLIEYAPAADGLSATNIGERKGHGYELEFDWHVKENLSLRGYITRQSSSNSNDDSDVADTPESTANLSINWGSLKDIMAGFQLTAVYDRQRALGDTRSEVDDYILANINFQYASGKYTLTAAIKNLLDEEIYEPSPMGSFIFNDFPQPSRSYIIGLHYSY